MKYVKLSLDLFKGRKYKFVSDPPSKNGTYFVKDKNESTGNCFTVVEIREQYLGREVFYMGWDCGFNLESQTNLKWMIFEE